MCVPEVVVLTGGTSGIGRIAATHLAEAGSTVAVIGRNDARGEELARSSAALPGEIRFHRADLAAQETVRSLADELRDTYDRIDRLVHNAGLSSSERIETVDGIERTFAVNHLAPYLLTHELIDVIAESAPARVVVTASEVHRRGTLDFDDLQFEEGFESLAAYGRSKLATIAFTIELAERLADTDVTAHCFHPGFVPGTNMFREARIWVRLMMRAADLVPGMGTSKEAGAARLQRLVTDPTFQERTGTYVTGNGIDEPAPTAIDPGVRDRLWKASAELVGVDSGWPDIG